MALGAYGENTRGCCSGWVVVIVAILCKVIMEDLMVRCLTDEGSQGAEGTSSMHTQEKTFHTQGSEDEDFLKTSVPFIYCDMTVTAAIISTSIMLYNFSFSCLE